MEIKSKCFISLSWREPVSYFAAGTKITVAAAAAACLATICMFPRTAVDNLIDVSFFVAPRAVVPMEQAHYWNGKHSLDVSRSTRNAI